MKFSNPDFKIGKFYAAMPDKIKYFENDKYVLPFDMVLEVKMQLLSNVGRGAAAQIFRQLPWAGYEDVALVKIPANLDKLPTVNAAMGAVDFACKSDRYLNKGEQKK